MPQEKPYTTTPPNRFVAMGDAPAPTDKAIDIDAPGASHKDQPKAQPLRKMRSKPKK